MRSRSANQTKLRTSIAIDGQRVSISMVWELAMSPSELWGIVSDLPVFLCRDPYHRQIIIPGSRIEPGADLVLVHSVCGWSWPRFGRILRWREGRSYSFSDLSARGSRRGFPHVFTIRTLAARHPEMASRLVIDIRGKWTAKHWPRWLVRSWLEFTCSAHAEMLKPILCTTRRKDASQAI